MMILCLRVALFDLGLVDALPGLASPSLLGDGDLLLLLLLGLRRSCNWSREDLLLWLFSALALLAASVALRIS